MIAYQGTQKPTIRQQSEAVAGGDGGGGLPGHAPKRPKGGNMYFAPSLPPKLRGPF